MFDQKPIMTPPPSPLRRRPVVILPDEPDNFLGIGKRARQRKQDKHEIRMDKRRAKVEKKRSKNEARIIRAQGTAEAKRNRSSAKRIKAEASQTLANQGIVDFKKDQEIGDKIFNTIGKFGKGGSGDSVGVPEDATIMTESQLADSGIGKLVDEGNQQPKGKNNTMLFIGIGVAVVVLVFVFIKMKK